MKITWYSHACVKLETDSHNILVDPFFTGNPTAPCGWEQATEGLTHLLLTHGHADHVGDTVAIAQKHKVPVVGMVELVTWLQKKGVEGVEMANFGGPIDLGQGHKVTLVPAWHSSASNEGQYLGSPAGLVIETPDHTIYHAGDTCVFGDMALIHEMYQPTIGFLPIGGRFTMDGKNAAFAAKKFFNFKHLIPIHYATFGLIAPTAEEFTKYGGGLPIRVLKPGESVTV